MGTLGQCVRSFVQLARAYSRRSPDTRSTPIRVGGVFGIKNAAKEGVLGPSLVFRLNEEAV